MENNSPKAQIIDTTFYSLGFPYQQDEGLIERNNYLSQVDDFFRQGAKLVFVDGDEDSGKTTICAQYAKENQDRAISVFFNPLNQIDYNTDYYCSNVVFQLKHLLKEEFDIGTEPSITFQQYQQYILSIRRLLRKGNRSLCLVIDGLNPVLRDKNEFVRDLFSLIPIGHESINILFTGRESDYRNFLPKGKALHSKSITLAGFSEPEIVQYLNVPLSSVTRNKEIYKITKGFPGRLRTLRRLLSNEHYSLNEITTSTTYLNWVELDCNSVDLTDSLTKAVLSLFALKDNLFTADEVSGICCVDVETNVNLLLDNINVLEKTNKYYCFISSAHKKYFANILRGNKKTVQDLLIQYYSKDSTIASLVELPKLYAERQDWPKVLNVIDEDYPRRIIQSTESIKNVSENFALGLQASQKLNKYTEMWRYSIESSIINELDNYLFWESEVRARISIHDFPGAVALAQSAILKVDRLKMLALIARKEKEIKNHVDEDLILVINQLYETTDLASVGDKIYDIVGDLIYAIPNLAIEMIEKASGHSSEKNINDWIVAKLSIAAIDSSIKETEGMELSRKLEAIQGLNNPEVKKINKAISFLVGNYSSDKVIEEIKKLSDSTERLRLLRLWLTNNRKSENDVALVIETALDELVESTSETAITLDILKELSDQLPFVQNIKEKDDLYYRFKKIENNLSDLGLKRNRYIYELNMFHAEFSIYGNQAERTINTIFEEIEAIPDILVRLEAYAESYIKLVIIQNKHFKDKIAYAYRRVLELAKELFKEGSDHLKLISYTLKTVSKKTPNLGLKIVELMNTQLRRERAKLIILESYLDNNIKYIYHDILVQIEKSLSFEPFKIALYVNILERYAEAKSLPYKVINELFYFFNKIQSFPSEDSKVVAYVYAYKIISKNTIWKPKFAAHNAKRILEAWEALEAEWVRVDAGFTICTDVSTVDSDFASKIFALALKLKDDSWADSSSVAESYLNGMKIVIRSFVGLLIAKDMIADDEKLIVDLMDRIPSATAKLDLWTELGFYSFQYDYNFAKKIFNSHVTPLLDELVKKEMDLSSVLDSLTFVYLFHDELIKRYFKHIPDIFIERVYENICDFYITKRNPFDVYDPHADIFINTYGDLSKAISVLGHVETDSNLFPLIETVCKSIQASRSDISKSQIVDLLNQIESIAFRRFPDTNNIKHEGYKILVKAKIAKIRRDVDNNIFWQQLIDETRHIPNTSDQVFVKAKLLEDIPFEKINKGFQIRANLYDEISKDMESFRSHYEFVQRVIDISEYMYAANRVNWKEVVKRAFTLCSELPEGKEGYSSQKSIVDSMYRIDPDYAKELIKVSDTDAPINKYGKFLKRHVEMLEMSAKIKNNKTLEDVEKENSRMLVSAIFNTLKSINSEKVSSKKINEVVNYFSLGNKLPLHEAMPIFLFYLANCNRTYGFDSGSGSLSNLHRENFRKAIKATNLIELLSHRSRANEKSFRTFFVRDGYSSSHAVNPGGRDSALGFIRNWMIEQVQDFVIIADPYFGKEDLEVLKIINEVQLDVDIDILASKFDHNLNIEQVFQDHWKSISDERPPFTNITFCWIPDQRNESPFHDRWILTKNSGIRMGTSLNSVGLSRESELSVMKPSEAANVLENILGEYVERRKRSVNNMRISYKSFSL